MNFRATLRRLTRQVAAVTGASAVALGASGVAAAQGVAVPVSPSESSTSELWDSPSARPGESDSPVRMDLVEAPTLINGSLTAGATLTLQVRLTNTTDQQLDQLTLTPQRAEAATSVPQARALMAEPYSSFGYYAQSSVIDGLAPEETRDVTLNIDTDPAEESTLSITEAGTYPVLVSLLGTQPGADGSDFLVTERFALPVTGANSNEPDETGETPGLSVVYPITAEVDLVPGETSDAPQQQPLILESEQLAHQLRPDGRLSRLLDVYTDSAPDDAVCLAVDPELIDVVDRMSRGYNVSDSRPLPERPQRLRDSWGESDSDESTPGEGAELAEEWITRLTELAATHCLISLPWANADLNALAATSDPWLMREALERGPTTLHRILGEAGVTNTVLSPTGYVDPATAQSLGWADHANSTVADEGMTTAWEEAVAQHSATGEPWAATTDAPEPDEPVRVLVADNTVWEEQAAGRFNKLAPGITAVRYQGSLAATLAATGDSPETVSYSNPQGRFLLDLDSTLARDITAAASLGLAVEEQQDGAPVLATLPLDLEPDTAQRTLETATSLIDSGRADALHLSDYASPGAEDSEALVDAESLIDAETPPFGSPYPDPGRFSDPEILRTSQQARYTDDLTRILHNDPALALTRYGYTLPLRRDQIRALSAEGRHSAGQFDEAVDRTDEILRGNGVAVQQLRGSIVLLPPGNVYTRTSEGSPLLIVAENRLPLPVTATIEYDSVEPARLDAPNPIRIPAHGSITVQMTADLPDDSEQSEIRVWLATLDGSQISTAVDLTVQTRGATLVLIGAAVVLILLLFVASALRLMRRRHRPPTPDEPPDSS